MTNEQTNFLLLLGQSVSGNCQKEYDFVEVDGVIESLAYTHQCIPFVYDACAEKGIRTPELWKLKTTYSAINNAHKLSVQKKVCDTLAHAGIPCAIFKGSAIAVTYPNPDIRSLGDIDLLVSEFDYERAILQFKDEITQEEAWHKFHFGIKVDGIDVEIHKHITYKTDDEAGKVLVEVMDGALDEIIWCKYDSFEFPMLKNKYHALALLHHKLRHFHKNNFVMRNLCDWACFVKSVEQKEWDEEVYPLIKKTSLDMFADACTLCADKYLGFNNNSKVKNMVADDIIDNLMEVLISCGLSKDKNNFSANIGALYSKYSNDYGKFVAFIKTVNEIARKKYSFAQKTYLLPVAWLCMMCQYLFGRKTVNFNVKKTNELACKRNKLYTGLRLIQEREK